VSENTFHFRLRNTLKDLDKIARALALLTKKWGLSTRCQCQTNLAIEELFTNIVKYGYQDGRDHLDHHVDVTILLKKPNLIITIADDGTPFNPLGCIPPDLRSPLENREIGGLGVHLAKAVMDKIEYHRRGEKNITILEIAIDSAKTMAGEVGR